MGEIHDEGKSLIRPSQNVSVGFHLPFVKGGYCYDMIKNLEAVSGLSCILNVVLYI